MKFTTRKKVFLFVFLYLFKGSIGLPVHTVQGSMDLSVLLSKLNAKIVTTNLKRDGGGVTRRGEFGKLDKGEALNGAKVWGRDVHVLGNIDVANRAVRLKGVAKESVKIVCAAGEIADDKSLNDLTLRVSIW